MTEIKQSINRNQVVGVLKEMNMEEITADVTLGRGSSNEKKVKCQQIAKKEFRNPMFLVESKGMDIGVDFFPVAEKKLDENGKVIDNSRFKSMQTVLNTYKAKINCKADEEPTRVKIDGSLRANEYADSKNNFDWKSFPIVSGFQITHSGVPEEDIADGEISGMVSKIMPEIIVKNDTEEETGRLKIELYSFDNNGATTPANFVVEPDLADTFQEFYEVRTSCKLYYEINVKQVGGKKAASSGFGRRDSKMVSGFSVTEFSVFRGDEAFEEENEYYINSDSMNSALNERNIMIENRVKEAKEKSDNPKPQGLKGSAKSGGSTPFSDNKKSNPFG